MKQTIAVTGTGRDCLPPDLAVLTMTLRAEDASFDAAQEKADGAYGALLEALSRSPAGVARQDVKTAAYEVESRYETQEEEGRTRRVFAGFAVRHTLRLELDFTPRALAETLRAASSSGAEPEVQVDFAVRDRAAFRARLLGAAAADARARAEALAQAEGLRLGELLRVTHDGGGDIGSPVRLYADTRRLAAPASFVPSDVEARETATFTWRLVRQEAE